MDREAPSPSKRIRQNFAGAQKGEAFTTLNPNPCLPALKDGDFVLWESNAMLAYAADEHGRGDTYPTNPRRRADIHRWLLRESSWWRLGQQPFLTGEAPTIADFAVAAPMHLHGWQQLPLEAHPHLRAWMIERMEAFPAWRAVLEGFKLPS